MVRGGLGGTVDLRAVVVIVAAAQASSVAWADPGRWASPLAPLHSGQIELAAGLGAGVNVFPPPYPAAPFPGAVLGVRWGITDSLQLALPLLATISTEVGDGWPRLSMTGGLASVGVSFSGLEVNATYLGPSVAATAHFVGERLSVVVSAETTTLVVVPASAASSSRLGGQGGIALRLDDAWSVGASVGMAASTQSFGAEQVQTTSAMIGANGSDVVASVPTVRWLVTDALSLELWTYLVMSSRTTALATSNGWSAAGANVSLTWRL